MPSTASITAFSWAPTRTQTLTGNASNQIISARNGNDTVNGAGGDDIILAGIGNDTINQSAADAGRDLVDGGVGLDTYVLTGTAAAETFQVLTRAAALTAGFTDLHAQTEIVITSNGAIIAELDNIEEITVNTLNTTVNDGNGVVNGGANGGDTITVIGDFTADQPRLQHHPRQRRGGTDTVDISGLDSAHRIVFTTNGGDDQVIGELRPQDVVSGAALVGDYSLPLVGRPFRASRVSTPCGGRPGGSFRDRIADWSDGPGLHLWSGQQDLF